MPGLKLVSQHLHSLTITVNVSLVTSTEQDTAATWPILQLWQREDRTGQGWSKWLPLCLSSPVGCFQTHFQNGDHSNSLVITFQWIRAEAWHWCCGRAEHGLNIQRQSESDFYVLEVCTFFKNPTLVHAYRKSDLTSLNPSSFIHALTFFFPCGLW